MSIITRLLGKRPTTAANLKGEIETQAAAIEVARAKIATAQAARKAAIEDFDADGHRAADEAIAEAGREIERRENAIERLNAAHVERVEVETRETFRKDDAALAAAGLALTKRIKEEYSEAAQKVTDIVTALAAFREKRKAMQARAKMLGEASTVEDAEDFRGVSAKKWSVSWRAPEGGYTMTGPIEDAPPGSIKWLNNEPIAGREGVEVRFRGGGARPDSLVEAIGNLPKLGVDEGCYHEATEPPKPASYGLR